MRKKQFLIEAFTIFDLDGKMLIKFCDISNPSRQWETYKRWTRQICEEFHAQGDEERKRNLPISNATQYTKID